MLASGAWCFAQAPPATAAHKSRFIVCEASERCCQLGDLTHDACCVASSRSCKLQPSTHLNRPRTQHIQSGNPGQRHRPCIQTSPALSDNPRATTTSAVDSGITTIPNLTSRRLPSIRFNHMGPPWKSPQSENMGCSQLPAHGLRLTICHKNPERCVHLHLPVSVKARLLTTQDQGFYLLVPLTPKRSGHGTCTFATSTASSACKLSSFC